MKKNYIDIPIFTTIQEIIEKDYTLSATQYKSLQIKNKNLKLVSSFLDRNLERYDLGYEVGSESYVETSPYYFIKAKALQEESYLLDITHDSVQAIVPQNFVNMKLKEGDIIISKDSNVGEIVILDKDYPNTMLCGALYRLPITNYKYYLLAFIKNQIFRDQIDFLVPRGSTIRHGKTKFLDCLIPLPNQNKENVIFYIELLMQAIINKEIEIKKRYTQVSDYIMSELQNNQLEGLFTYSFPCINEIMETTRLDSSVYSKRFKEIKFMIENYKYGYFYIPKENIKGGNTPKKRIISEEDNLSNYWVTPTIFDNIGLLNSHPTIDCFENNICSNCLLIVNRTSKGKDGLYVGLSYFYDFSNLGAGHHNQGIYRIQNYCDSDLVFYNAILNSNLYREYCGALSMGSKMKEIKVNDITSIPFPNFPIEKKEKIVSLYYTPFYKYDSQKCSILNFMEYDNSFNLKAGIYELDHSKRYLEEKLNKAINNIINDITVIIEF